MLNMPGLNSTCPSLFFFFCRYVETRINYYERCAYDSQARAGVTRNSRMGILVGDINLGILTEILLFLLFHALG